ncbi:MAG: hypothetical protein OEX07_13370 [Gammaproteobacteria bacterium]|nr:hypothetical protein [Gammaproteobacteria bacterium]
MSRKFKVFITLEVLVTLLFIIGLLGIVTSPATYADKVKDVLLFFEAWSGFTLGSSGIYGIGNVGEHLSKRND